MKRLGLVLCLMVMAMQANAMTGLAQESYERTNAKFVEREAQLVLEQANDMVETFSELWPYKH